MRAQEEYRKAALQAGDNTEEELMTQLMMFGDYQEQRGEEKEKTETSESSMLRELTTQPQPVFAALHSDRLVLELFKERRKSQKFSYLKKTP